MEFVYQYPGKYLIHAHKVEFSEKGWALGAAVPGLASLALLPLFTFCLARPTVVDASEARKKAQKDLHEMGNWSRNQKVMGAIFVMLLILWSTKGIHGMGPGLVAWIGVCVLLVSGTHSWKAMTGNAKAWDTLIWLGGLLTMANALKSEGVVQWFAEKMQGQVAGLGTVTLVVVLALIYFYSMYGFSMLTAHIAAFVGAFFAIAAGANAPTMLIVPLLAYFSNLSGCTTNYSTGPVIIYFELGYVETPRWFQVGALMSLFHLVVWLGLGMAWWKLLGWW